VAVTSDVGIRHAVVSPDGKRLVYSRGQTVANVWRVPWLEGRTARWADAEAITEGEAYVEFVSLSPDGKTLVTTSDASGNPDLWLVDIDTREHAQLTHERTPDWGPSFSPDGESVAFYAYRSGNRDLWTLPTAGGPARQLTDHPSADMYPTYSPDGESIAFYSVRTGNRDLWVMPAAGGEASQLTRFPGDDLFPDWSPTGESIAFFSDRDGTGRIWAVTPDGDDPRPLTSGPGRFPRFSRDGQKLLFTGWGERIGNIFELELASGRERAVTELSGRSGNLGSYVLATDDRFVYFTWEQNVGDLFIVDLR
jgi:Tol biopolymer transport system component